MTSSDKKYSKCEDNRRVKMISALSDRVERDRRTGQWDGAVRQGVMWQFDLSVTWDTLSCFYCFISNSQSVQRASGESRHGNVIMIFVAKQSSPWCFWDHLSVKHCAAAALTFGLSAKQRRVFYLKFAVWPNHCHATYLHEIILRIMIEQRCFCISDSSLIHSAIRLYVYSSSMAQAR